jgi:perosamine synthetase
MQFSNSYKKMEAIRWNEPRFDEEDLREVTSVLKENYVNEGPKTKEVEESLKKLLGVKYVILTANCTASLFLAVKADAIIRGVKDFEVIVPDMTMIASATSVGWAGGKAVLADVLKESFVSDSREIEKKITKKTTAIIAVDILGRSPDWSALTALANKHNITLIEDAAGALGSKVGEKFLGTFGKVGCYSLQSNKIITCGQGGFVTTDDDRYYEAMRRLRDFGRMSNKEEIHQAEGYNLKFSDLAAALVKSQLTKLDHRKQLLIHQRKLYESELKFVKEIIFPKIDYANGAVPLWVDAIVKNRKSLVEFLKSKNVFSRECWPAVHRNPPYSYNGGDEDFPNASAIADNCLWLPNGPAITTQEILVVCNHIKQFYQFQQAH